MYFVRNYFKVFLSLLAVLWCSLTTVQAQPDSAKFKVIAFYSASWDQAHISFAHECNRWFPKMAQQYGFEYDSTKDWSNLNAEFLAQYQVVMFLDNQPGGSQKAAFEQYMRNGGSWMGFHVCAFNQDPSAWDWYYNKFLGLGSYKNNTWAPSSAVLQVEDQTHPSTVNLPETFTASVNEWYAWTKDLRTQPNINILCSIHPSSFPLGDGSGSGGASEIWRSGYYPVVWTNTDYNMMYINMGHNAVNYSNNTDKSHTFGNEKQDKLILDGLFWLASKNMPDPRSTNLKIISPDNGQLFTKPSSIGIEVSATDSDGVAKVEFFNGSTLLGTDSVSPFQFTWENNTVGSYTLTVKATDLLKNVVSTSVSISVQGQGAYNDNIAQIPGKIEAENFDYGGQGKGYSDNEAANQGSAYRSTEGVDIESCSDDGGGYNIGYTKAGEWMKYTVNITQNQAYKVNIRVASSNASKKFHIELDGTNITGSITVPKTGGWQTWQTVSAVTPVLTTGQKELKFVFETDGFNLNYFSFSKATVGVNHIGKMVSAVYPNPSNGVVFLMFNEPLSTADTLTIHDTSGKKLKTIEGQQLTGKKEISIDFSTFGKGLYILKLNNVTTQSMKVIIE